MGMVSSNVLTLVSSHRDEYDRPSEIAGTGVQVVQLDCTENSRIKALEREIEHLRSTFDQMVYQKTKLLERRLEIVEFCNSTLGKNYRRMQRMYLDLLEKTHA